MRDADDRYGRSEPLPLGPSMVPGGWVHGESGPLVTLLHGGPGAPGHLRPVARVLADEYRVIEPFERRSGAEPLSVRRHVEDVETLLRARAGDDGSIVLGFSSGAVTALSFAAAYPQRVAGVVLVSSATMDPTSRAEFKVRLHRRMDDATRSRVEQLRGVTDPDRRLLEQSRTVMPFYFVDPITTDTGDVWLDGRGHDETWRDMLRLQERGEHPAAFAGIRVPVLMIQGAEDPHPGSLIRASLQPHLPQLEYVELEACGHYPWLERAAREAFFDHLRGWLKGTSAQAAAR